jgi:hypothetical protein
MEMHAHAYIYIYIYIYIYSSKFSYLSLLHGNPTQAYGQSCRCYNSTHSPLGRYVETLPT